MAARPKKKTKRKDSPRGRELLNKIMKGARKKSKDSQRGRELFNQIMKGARKKTRVVRTRIAYRDIERLRITGEDTVVFTMPDESRLVVQWLKKHDRKE